MDEIDFVINALKSGEIFFFSGSGISYASNLPSAYAILEHTANAFLPTNIREKEKKDICNTIQPEVFYESIIGMTKSYECLDIWRSLYKGEQKNHQVQCEPNFAHLFITEYSSNNSLPIITTNFDSMFEQACELLNVEYRILLPTNMPPETYTNTLSICKIHGSVQDNQGEYSPHALWTTMTQITRVNTKWIEHICNLMKQKHLCFVGYSGRDIDLFPYLAEAPQKIGAKKIIWINKFNGDHSDLASQSCNALRVYKWPSELFEYASIELSMPMHVKKESPCNGTQRIEELLESLEESLANKELLEDVEKELLYCVLLAKLGKYQIAHKYATKIKNTKLSQFSRRSSRHLLLLTCARLSHEISHYESCQAYAKEVLHLLRNKDEYDVNVALQASCLVSEAHRMTIPNDIYFGQQRKFADYLHIFFVVANFISLLIIEKLRMCCKKLRYSSLSPETQHELIEHRVRFYSLMQSILGSPQHGWNKYAKAFLSRRWDSIRDLSYRVGYSAGIANSGKFKYRLTPLEKTKSESANIYDLTTSATGSELLVRNEADQLLRDKKFEESRLKFLEYSNMAEKSGNTLNEIKGIIGYAYANHVEGSSPLLTYDLQKRFCRLIKLIEGKRWQDHFSYIEEIICANPVGNLTKRFSGRS